MMPQSTHEADWKRACAIRQMLRTRERVLENTGLILKSTTPSFQTYLRSGVNFLAGNRAQDFTMWVSVYEIANKF